MKFSERKGLTKVSSAIQKETISEELRISLWNAFTKYAWNHEGFLDGGIGETDMDLFSTDLWFHFLKWPIDGRSRSTYEVLLTIRKWFFDAKWFEVYDFVEYSLNVFSNPDHLYSIDSKDLVASINKVLEMELSAFRYVGGVVTEITSNEEVEMLDMALADSDHPAVKAHLRRALELLSDRKNPDYRNSIKESISAVESIAQKISGESKATLADALKKLEKNGKIHAALKDGFIKIYGYTSDSDGIRHAMMEEPNLTANDAKFFLLSCTSFINYLKGKTE